MSRGWIAGILWGALVCGGTTPTTVAQSSFSIGSPQELEAEARIRERLRSSVSFRFRETPLAEVLQHVKEHCEINLLIHERSLEDLGVDQQQEVSVELANVSLEAFLNNLLSNLELTWLIQDETLLITTPEHAESQLRTRIYPVADLVFPPGSRNLNDADYDTLINIITSTIAPDTWDHVGGPGAIEAEPNSLALVVSQTDDVHHPVEDLLAVLRNVRRVQGFPQLPVGAPRTVHEPTGTIRQPISPRSSPRRYATVVSQDWRIPRLHE